MTTNKLVIILALLVLAVLASQARAMIIYGYESKKHDRFYTGSDRAFIGEGYDWSGVFAKGVHPDVDYGPGWATMISPQYFLTANHVAWAPGATINFYENDDLAKANPHSYLVDDFSVNFGGGDLALRRLTTPLDPSHNIAYYPILDFDNENNYKNITFFGYGRTDSVGRNQIDSLGNVTVEHPAPLGNVTAYAMQYDYDRVNGVGADENLLRHTTGGDSGGPSFVAFNGGLALIGIHWYNGPKDVIPKTFSGDSFVPHYIDIPGANNDLTDYMNIAELEFEFETVTPLGGDANMDGIVDDIDAAILAANWGQTSAAWTQGDFSGDQVVNEADADILAANWQQSFGASSSGVPEPTTAILLLIGSLSTAALHFRRRACSR